jgi:hypothetical protein
MKTIYNYILTFILVALIAVGCGDKLNVEPVTNIDEKNALKTSADVEGLLVGAYSAISSGDVYGGNVQRDAELIGDDLDNSELFWDGTFVAPGEIWTKNMLITNDQAESTWLDSYKVINICNNILANLNLVTEVKRDRVEGEAKFLRGTIYFELVRIYARTWTDPNGTPATNPGVPIVLTPTTLENAGDKIPRSSVADVYNRVFSDLNDAANLLPDDNVFFANRFAAHGMLSRVYLMQNDYANAAIEADIVISEGDYALEDHYENAFNKTSPANSSEDVFSIQVTEQDGVNNMFTFFAATGRGDIYVEPAHFDLYEPDDDRLNLFYDDERTGKWNNQFGNINIIRLSEMYLTRAEANFREGTTVGATPLEDVNIVRERVHLPDLAILTLEDILKERHLELAFEGHRIHDIKRTQGTVGVFNFDAPELIFPIPQRERNINPDLEQNPGYGQ